MYLFLALIYILAATYLFFALIYTTLATYFFLTLLNFVAKSLFLSRIYIYNCSYLSLLRIDIYTCKVSPLVMDIYNFSYGYLLSIDIYTLLSISMSWFIAILSLARIAIFNSWTPDRKAKCSFVFSVDNVSRLSFLPATPFFLHIKSQLTII